MYLGSVKPCFQIIVLLGVDMFKSSNLDFKV